MSLHSVSVEPNARSQKHHLCHPFESIRDGPLSFGGLRLEIQLGTSPDGLPDLINPDFGQLLDACRPYLLQIANEEIADGLAQHISPSDLVQETFIDAIKGFDRFQGKTKQELHGWLRQILIRNMLDARKRYIQTKKRNGAKEIPICAADHSLIQQIPDPGSSPSSIAHYEDSTYQLWLAIDQLPEDYRLVIRQRHFEGLPFDEIAQRMGRSTAAVRKLWLRGVDKLSEALDPHESAG